MGNAAGGGALGSIRLARGQMRTMNVHVRLSLAHAAQRGGGRVIGVADLVVRARVLGGGRGQIGGRGGPGLVGSGRGARETCPS